MPPKINPIGVSLTGPLGGGIKINNSDKVKVPSIPPVKK